MSLRLNLANVNENRRIVLGTVKAVNPGTGSLEGRCVHVVIEGTVWNKETENEELQEMSIAFFNSDTAPMMDRVINAGVSEGNVLTVDVFEKNGRFYGNAFKYRGHWVIPGNGDRNERNIFMGTVTNPTIGETKNGQKYLRISMPDDSRKGEETKWVSITFMNNENSNIADRAIRVLTTDKGEPVEEDENGRKSRKAEMRTDTDGKKLKAVVICGPGNDFNGRDTYFGNEFITIS